MELLFIAAGSAPPMSMATASEYLFGAGACMLVVMTLVYLWYTLGTARLAKRVAQTQRRSQSSAKAARAGKAAKAADASGGVATLVREEVILNEQPDGETPIALDHGLVAVGRIGSVIGWFAVAMLLLSQVLRTIVTHHAPWSDLFEFSVSFTTAMLLCYLIFEARYHERVRAWGIYICAFALLTLGIGFGVGMAYGMVAASSQLIPALQDPPILTLHVSMAIFAYALFTVSFGAAAVMLAQGGEGRRISWLPSAEAADELAYKAIIIGFPLLALNLILGAYWANYAWGHYWSWDPKETAALVTWLIYAVYLHARGMRGWRGKRVAWLLIIGFAATLFTYYGVSFLVPGLHTYAVPQF